MSAPYELTIGDRDEDGHHHVRFNVVGWKNSFNEDASEYFEVSGICRPERAQSILEAVNKHSDLLERVTSLEDVLEQAAEYFDNKSDVVDGDYGSPEPNREMAILSLIRSVLDRGSETAIPSGFSRPVVSSVAYDAARGR